MPMHTILSPLPLELSSHSWAHSCHIKARKLFIVIANSKEPFTVRPIEVTLQWATIEVDGVFMGQRDNDVTSCRSRQTNASYRVTTVNQTAAKHVETSVAQKLVNYSRLSRHEFMQNSNFDAPPPEPLPSPLLAFTADPHPPNRQRARFA